MTSPHRPIRRPLIVVLAVLGTMACGCALDRAPRIDPTGQQLLIFPDQPGTAVAALPPTTATAATLSPPNMVASPVYTDPYLPGPGGTTSGGWQGQPVMVGQPVTSTSGQPVPGAVLVSAQPGEAITISPSRVLAPIGSEVILIGGVCAENGYLRTNERVEWMIDRAGTGQIVTVGGRGELDIFRLPTNTPRKVDNYFAIGSTSPYDDLLDRGTPDPTDDIQIRRGDAWITVSSPAEGTSYVTAYAPHVANWAGRTARATIYWIDAQWAFPPPVVLAPGESHTLTTTITRQSDGAPIAGWIVRYRVVAGEAGLGYDQGQTSDVSTDNRGRASVEITPTDGRAGTTNIQIEIVRPEQAGSAASPRVTLGAGATSITWASGGISGTPLPPTTFPPADSSPITPPPGNWQSPTLAPTPVPTLPPEPRPSPAAGTPDLAVRIDQRTTGPLSLGSTVEFLVTVTNQGDGTARNVKIVDEFDLGLANDAAAPGEQFIKSDAPFDLAPGESQPLPLVFRITQPGRLSHNVTVTADNAVMASERAFLSVEGAATGIPAPPALRVTMDADLRRTVGEVAQFKIRVENTGTVPAQNVVVTTDRDAELKAVEIDPNKAYDEAEYSRSGTLRWTTPVIAPRSSETYLFACECMAPAQQACARVEVQAAGLDRPEFDQRCVEIRPRLDGGGSTVAPPLGGPPPETPRSGKLEVLVTENAAPRVGQRMIVFLRLENNTASVQQNVRFRALIPAELRADLQQLQASVPWTSNPWEDGRLELLFGPIADLAPGAIQTVAIPVDAVVAGSPQLHVEATSTTATNPNAKVIQILPR